ncbi:hypothetical protein [Bacillus badius]|uniref:Uncharacterized protein n=1 Tax=Bacillus badius TaxID=1455 RepID=A0ABR5B132_BACBA|nr:hypothetical protein [Bacillus badius]KIL80705.1 hypothetical protein SD77_0553 [Bacillus badius]MED4715367.1 hypothetical protein [Bacillus badius]
MEKVIEASSGFVIQPRLQFKTIKDKLLYQMLMEEANYAASARCEVGQTIIILTNLSKEIGWSRDIIKGSLDRLERMNYIQMETLPQKRGLLITVCHYKEFQSLATYQKEKVKKESKNPQENPQGDPHEEPQENPHEGESENPCGSKEEGMSKNQNPQENPHENTQEKPHEIPHTITAFINSIINSNININKTLKEYITEANVKSMNLTSADDMEIFVDFALRTNALPAGMSKKILISYFECIRLTRQTCTISAALLAKHIEKLSKYSINQLHYALWKHVEQHDDKREQYTLGILRNTKEHEARRGLMILKNKKGVIANGNDEQLATAVGAEQSSTRAEAERLEELARKKGLAGGTIRDVNVDY